MGFGAFHPRQTNVEPFKFDSGSGWPSFTKPITKEKVVEKSDRALGMDRTEVRGAKSDAHLGHVFDDGPGPKGSS